MSFAWKGVFPAVTTQLHEDQSLDEASTVKHIELLIESGVSGLVMCGSLGENQTLKPQEKRTVVQWAVQAAKGRVPVVAGVAESSSALAMDYMRDCCRVGASAFMIMPAMVYRADEREALRYFRTVGESTPLPWMLYNNPLAYSVDITPNLMRELVDIPNLAAIKESSGDSRRITELKLAVGNRFAIFAGVDDLIMQCAVQGIDGWVAGAGLAFPPENQRLWNLMQSGAWEEARKLFQWCAPLMKLDTHVKFVQYIKLAIQEAGLGREWVREPRLPLMGEERERVLKVIHEALAARPMH